MVSNVDVVRLLKQKFPDLVFYPSLFPLDAPDNAGIVELYSPSSLRSGMFTLTVSVKIRSRHPKDAEAQLIRLIKEMDRMTDVQVGQANLMTVQAMNAVPTFVGMGINSLYQYTIDFKFLMDVMR